jgi:hypothetical protein
MRCCPVPSDLLRDPRALEGGELSVSTILIVVACAALVVAPTLVALTHGWDYRVAVMIGAILATALARWGWRALPPERVADRLALAFAGTPAAALLCVYASDWLDWRPLGIDDAVAGMAVGLALLLMGPVHQALREEESVPTAAGLALQALALAPVAWVMFLYGFHSDELEPAAKFARIALPGLGTGLVIAVLGFAFALRQDLLYTALPLAVFAGLELVALLHDGGGPIAVAASVGLAATVWMSLRTASARGWPNWRPVGRDAVARVTGGVGYLTRRVSRALRPAMCMPSAASLGLVALAFAPAAWWVFGVPCWDAGADTPRLHFLASRQRS